DILQVCPTSTVRFITDIGRLLISSIRNRLSAETGRMLMCLGCWSQQGLINDDDMKAVTKLPTIEE
ncbi:hypothetical protein DFH08DRAFT_639460, partial [Mycena albidolilacea]